MKAFNELMKEYGPLIQTSMRPHPRSYLLYKKWYSFNVNNVDFVAVLNEYNYCVSVYPEGKSQIRRTCLSWGSTAAFLKRVEELINEHAPAPKPEPPKPTGTLDLSKKVVTTNGTKVTVLSTSVDCLDIKGKAWPVAGLLHAGPGDDRLFKATLNGTIMHSSSRLINPPEDVYILVYRTKSGNVRANKRTFTSLEEARKISNQFQGCNVSAIKLEPTGGGFSVAKGVSINPEEEDV